MTTLELIAAKIRRERRKKRLTQQQLADAANISRATLGSIEDANPTDIATLDRIASVLGCEIRMEQK